MLDRLFGMSYSSPREFSKYLTIIGVLAAAIIFSFVMDFIGAWAILALYRHNYGSLSQVFLLIFIAMISFLLSELNYASSFMGDPIGLAKIILYLLLLFSVPMLFIHSFTQLRDELASGSKSLSEIISFNGKAFLT
jgi:hypothetical protein